MNIYILRETCIVRLLPGFHEDTLVSVLKLFRTKFQRLTDFFSRTGIVCLQRSQRNDPTTADDSSVNPVEFLRCKFQKVSLQTRFLYSCIHLPNYMDVVYHDDKAIDDHPLMGRQELHTFDENIFILIWFQQLFPSKNCCCKKMRIFSYYFRHNCKTQQSIL